MSRSILQREKICYLCPRTIGLERHHILSGANRKWSEKLGLWVYLCHEHHTGKRGAQYDKDLNLLLKREAQKAFEETHSHEEWMEIFKRNYL